MTRNRALQGKIALVPDIPDNLSPLRADGRMIKQILLNLLSNAVRFTPEGGTVSLAVVPGSQKFVTKKAPYAL
jgi:signal transduction histidine kinase